MALFDYLVAFIPMLGILIFVHELGHFLVAKACGVRVLKFSLGFGPPVGFGSFRLRWERAGTEYVIAWIPLGGYVKMLGENLEIQGEEPEPALIDARPDEFLQAKPVWQKLAITFAGPLMNIAFPVLVFAGVLMVGLPRAAPVIGTVEMGSPAEEVGLRPGDRIVAVDGEPARFWEDIDEAVRRHVDGTPLRLEVERGAERLEFVVPVRVRQGLDAFGDVEPIGWIGIANGRLPALVGVPAADVPAARAGLRSGDLVLAVGDAPVEDWVDFEQAFARAAAAGGPVHVRVKRGPPEQELSLELPAAASVDAIGVIPAAVLVAEVAPDSPAEQAGLQRGDLILAVDGRPVGSFGSFAETVRASQGRTLELTFARNGELHTVPITPRREKVQSPYGIEGMEIEVYRIGIASGLPPLPGERVVERYSNPISALPRAAAMTWDITVQFLRGLGRLATGGVAADQIAGPIGIAEIARKSLDLGWMTYLGTMVLISINLGILNLLPIPVLDGGQALIYIVEAVKGSPLSIRSRELVQTIGLTLLAMLMGLAFWNDLSRNWMRFVEWLRSGA